MWSKNKCGADLYAIFICTRSCHKGDRVTGRLRHWNCEMPKDLAQETTPFPVDSCLLPVLPMWRDARLWFHRGPGPRQTNVAASPPVVWRICMQTNGTNNKHPAHWETNKPTQCHMHMRQTTDNRRHTTDDPTTDNIQCFSVSIFRGNGKRLQGDTQICLPFFGDSDLKPSALSGFLRTFELQIAAHF